MAPMAISHCDNMSLRWHSHCDDTWRAVTGGDWAVSCGKRRGSAVLHLMYISGGAALQSDTALWFVSAQRRASLSGCSSSPRVPHSHRRQFDTGVYPTHVDTHLEESEREHMFTHAGARSQSDTMLSSTQVTLSPAPPRHSPPRLMLMLLPPALGLLLV